MARLPGPELARALRTPAARGVDRLRAARDLDGLIAALGVPKTRVRAALSLGGIGDQRGIDVLVVAADDGDPQVAGAALLGLGMTQRSEFIPLLSARVRDVATSDHVRECAAGALAQLQAFDVLDEVAGDESLPNALRQSAASTVRGARGGRTIAARRRARVANSKSQRL